jgi:alpha-beta hydrolase superfamily lysophospholipase
VAVTADLLGDGFEIRILPLGDGADNDLVASLVRFRAEDPVHGAVLYVHGFSDYFFQRHVAAHFAERGYDFYAIDLRGYGRSLRPSRAPNYVAAMSEHFEELDAAVELIRSDGHQRPVVVGHSTGGLITTLWAHERRADPPLSALVLNSPWFDLAEPWLTRVVGTPLIDVVGRFAPRLVLREGLGGVYGQSIHRDHHGEWEYDPRWKPVTGFPVLAGWLRAVRRGHAALHRGLDVPVPVLVLHSGRSHLRAKRWTEEAMTADTVLDVGQIARWAPKVGRDVDVVEVEGGLHDLFLSAEPVRNKVFAVVDDWLAEHRRG